ncbi:MAG TPA: hypothetical protein VM821_05320 [Abditibacteriaceae bacterium]|nr:hypothetical protein [Abditibacteriaceae bacterium]
MRKKEDSLQTFTIEHTIVANRVLNWCESSRKPYWKAAQKQVMS